MKVLILTLCMAFIGCIAAAERPALAQCEKVTDDQIVADIYNQIRADKSLAGQVSHINVVSLYAAVKFQGWTNTQKDYDNVSQIGLSTSCVRLLNLNNFLNAPPPAGSPLLSAGGCGSGMKACGDICIPSGDACNISVVGFLRIMFDPDREGRLALVVNESGCHF
jgi:hypothetical protein